MSDMNPPEISLQKPPIEAHLLQEVLSPESRVLMHYGNHTNGGLQRLQQLDDILRGNYMRTGWDLGTISARAVDNNYSKSLGNALLFAMDGGVPLAQELNGLPELLKNIHDPSNEAGRLILEMFTSKGIPSKDVDRLLEAIEVHWGKLPFNPMFQKSKEVLLLRGDLI
jgi:hypothetical protein